MSLSPYGVALILFPHHKLPSFVSLCGLYYKPIFLPRLPHEQVFLDDRLLSFARAVIAGFYRELRRSLLIYGTWSPHPAIAHRFQSSSYMLAAGNLQLVGGLDFSQNPYLQRSLSAVARSSSEKVLVQNQLQ